MFHVFSGENTGIRKTPFFLSRLQLKRWLHLPCRDKKCFAFEEVEVNKNQQSRESKCPKTLLTACQHWTSSIKPPKPKPSHNPRMTTDVQALTLPCLATRRRGDTARRDAEVYFSPGKQKQKLWERCGRDLHPVERSGSIACARHRISATHSPAWWGVRSPRALLPPARADVYLCPNAALLWPHLAAPLWAVTIAHPFRPTVHVVVEVCSRPSGIITLSYTPQLPPSPQHQRHIPRAILPIKASSLRAPGRALRWYRQCPITLPRNAGVKLEATWARSQGDDTQGLMGITQMFKQGADSISGSTARTWLEARNMLAAALTYQQQTTLQTACKQAPT